MREKTLLDFRAAVRAALCEKLDLPAKTVVEITNAIAMNGVKAIDQEVSHIAETCGFIPADEIGGSF